MFPKLPMELQSKIWSFALPGPRTITVFENTAGTEHFIGVKGDGEAEVHHNLTFNRPKHNAHQVPAILHACYNSRTITLKTYKLAFAPRLGWPIYFDFGRDTLYMKDVNALRAFYGPEAYYLAVFPEDIEHFESEIRHISIGDDDLNDEAYEKLERLGILDSLILAKGPVNRGFHLAQLELNVATLKARWKARWTSFKAPGDNRKLPQVALMTKKALEAKARSEKVSLPLSWTFFISLSY